MPKLKILPVEYKGRRLNEVGNIVTSAFGRLIDDFVIETPIGLRHHSNKQITDKGKSCPMTMLQHKETLGQYLSSSDVYFCRECYKRLGI